MGAGALLVAVVLTAGPGSDGGRLVLGADPGPCTTSGATPSPCANGNGTCMQTYSKCRTEIKGVENKIICSDNQGATVSCQVPSCQVTTNAFTTEICVKNTPAGIE